jgi:Fe2+ or Zn2+ uptake regulation protein
LNNNANNLHLDWLNVIVFTMNKSKLKNRYADQLREAGFKATKSKLQLLAILADSKEPLSVNSIFRKFKSSIPDIVTVYRSLKELHAAGIIRQINLQHGHAHYEYAGLRDHHHFICNRCGKVEDIENCNLNAVIKKALKSSKDFTKATDHSFELFGICRSCTL